MALPGLILKFGIDHTSSGGQTEKVFIDFVSQGAAMVLEVQTFQYIVQNEAGETIGGYNSTDEPPVTGDVIQLPDVRNWEAAEVLGVTMMLSKHYNMIVLKVKPADGYRL